MKKVLRAGILATEKASRLEVQAEVLWQRTFASTLMAALDDIAFGVYGQFFGNYL